MKDAYRLHWRTLYRPWNIRDILHTMRVMRSIDEQTRIVNELLERGKKIKSWSSKSPWENCT
jgi:hypothetical protein